jgi:hypothetical protein
VPSKVINIKCLIPSSKKEAIKVTGVKKKKRKKKKCDVENSLRFETNRHKICQTATTVLPLLPHILQKWVREHEVMPKGKGLVRITLDGWMDGWMVRIMKTVHIY